MKVQRLISIISFLTVAFIATAQVRETYGGDVEIMELDENRATFSSVGIDINENDVLVAAEKNLFQKLLYVGVEGFNDDKPLVERNSPVLDAFFHAKYQKEFLGVKTKKKDVKNSLAYRAYVVSSQLESSPKKNVEGKYAGTAIIVINSTGLINYLKINKVILDSDSVTIKENVKVERPNFLKKRRQNQQSED